MTPRRAWALLALAAAALALTPAAPAAALVSCAALAALAGLCALTARDTMRADRLAAVEVALAKAVASRDEESNRTAIMWREYQSSR